MKIPAKLTNFFHPAKFWDPRPPYRPEISVCRKNFVFPPLGDLPPFVFAENDSIQKKIFFYLRYVNVYYNRRKKLWCNMTSKLLQMITSVMPFFYKKLHKKNLLQNLVTFWWQKKSCKKMALPRWSFAKVLKSWRVTS